MSRKDPMVKFRELCPLTRLQAEAMAMGLWQNHVEEQEEDYLNQEHCIKIPDEDTTYRLRLLLEPHIMVVELCAGTGMLHLTLERMGLLTGIRYVSVDHNKGLVQHSQGLVLCRDNLVAIQEFQPTCVVCSWPWPEFDLVDGVMADADSPVRQMVVIGPWLGPQAGKVQVGRAIEDDLPNGWCYEYIPDIVPVDVHFRPGASRVYLLKREG